MALHTKKNIFPLLVFLKIVCAVKICPEACVNNVTEITQCSYNVTLKEITKVIQIRVCCDNPVNSEWISGNINKTFSEVKIVFSENCYKNYIVLNYTQLDTFSINLRNISLRNVTLNLRKENLREIDLSWNKITYISKGMFNNFTSLRKLLLSKNEIVNISAGSFDGLSKLESLDLSENNLTLLSDVFTPLKNLQYLNLSRNRVEVLYENYFNNWLLQHLDISNNNLKKVSPGALQSLPNLARLLLSDNPHLGITHLDTQLLVGTGRRLQQIDASRTGLLQVPEAFTHSVRFLSLSGNRISTISCGDLDSYPLLQSLDFSDNKILSIEEDSLGRLEMLLFLNLNNNMLAVIPKTLPSELKYLSINNNRVSNLSVSDLKNLPNLKILMLQGNQIQYIEDHVFDDLLSLEMLDLSNNPLRALTSNTFDGPLSLRDLRLCYLNVTVPQKDGSFPVSSPESIQMLHLQSSPSLARQLLADSAALAALSHLQYLDLRMNNLTEIRNDLLFYLGQLKTLRLHGNSFNCSAELWLKDWLNWNKSSSKGETCYYSSSETRVEEPKYNCTFSETFTISDSLPPVNLYSTEMINKLLRYYGYLNNKTEKITTKPVDNNKYDRNTKPNINLVDNFDDNNIDTLEELDNTISHPDNKNNNNLNNDYMNESSLVKARESSKILDQNRIQNEQSNIEHRFLDLDPNFYQTKNLKKSYYEEVSQARRKYRYGKRLNTPLNITKKLDQNITKTDRSITETAIENVTLPEGFTTNANIKTEFSPYQSSPSMYAQYVGTIAVIMLIVMSLILWVSFRLRFRRRATLAEEREDQIEVSNISGGVLW